MSIFEYMMVMVSLILALPILMILILIASQLVVRMQIGAFVRS